MSATILPFKRPLRRQLPRPTVVLCARAGTVTLATDDLELGLSPAQARELARDLLELADDADGAP
jgi:hypothetical protein